MSKIKLNIAIIGATGFTGLDLVFLLSNHPKVKIVNLCAKKNLGKHISFFDSRLSNNLPKISSINKINWKSIDLVYLSLPNGESQKLINKYYSKFKKLKFIDLSADFRIDTISSYKKNYGIEHKAPNLTKKSIYSISEFVKDKIRNFRIISNPGCYPTSVQIPLIPLINKKLIKTKNIIIDAKSGYSGAGKNYKKKFKHKDIYNSTYAYGVKTHRHIVEIDQELKKHTRKNLSFTFNPYLIPTFRGMLTSIYVNIENRSSAKKIRNYLYNFYKKRKFVKVLKLNSQVGTGTVLNTNFCEISVCQTRIKNRILILSTIDNLIKGASGQAVQNMNLLYNFSENEGLK